METTNTELTFIERPAEMPTGTSKGRSVQHISHRLYEDGREAFVCNFCNREAEKFHQILGHISRHTNRHARDVDPLAIEITNLIRNNRPKNNSAEVKRLAAQVNSLKAENKELKRRLAAFDKFRDMLQNV